MIHLYDQQLRLKNTDSLEIFCLRFFFFEDFENFMHNAFLGVPKMFLLVLNTGMIPHILTIFGYHISSLLLHNCFIALLDFVYFWSL